MVILICALAVFIIYKLIIKCHELEKDVYKLNEIAADEEYWIARNGRSDFLESYFKERNITRIAVYGAGYLGRALITALENSECVRFEYIIDRNKIQSNMPVYTIEEELPCVDMVIVTPIMEYKNIKNMLQCKGMKNIVSIESLIWEN